MTISSVAIIGAGTMGAGIAITTLCAGFPTILIDRNPDSLIRARARLDAFLDRAVAKGRMPAETADAARQRLVVAQDYAAAAPADLVIEAVFERLDIKTDLMQVLEPLLRPDCILATNTSCLCVSDIAQVLDRPGRFIGLHYFSPAEINPVVEVVPGRATDPSLATRLQPFLERTGKVALPCKDRNGFALNRFFCPYVNEAVRCHAEGLGSPAQIDALACDLFGLAIGPFATTNIVGAPVMLHALENLAHLGPFYAPAPALRALAAEGGLWPLAGETGPPAEAAQIRARLQAALYRPLAELLAEQVATAEDIDRGARLALRFGIAPAATFAALPVSARAQILAPMVQRFG